MDRKASDRRAVLETIEARHMMSVTYYVAQGGSDGATGTSDQAAFATLQRAADAVGAGDTVVVRAGTYPAGFVLGWDSSPKGTADAPITFAADPGTVITGRNARTPDGINLEAGTDHVIIKGFTVQNTSGTITRAGIRVVGSDHVSVIGNTADLSGRWGIFTGFADDLLIEGNVTSRSALEHGIYVSNSGDRPVIRGNVSFGNRSCGIHMNGDISQGGDGIISGALVEGNRIFNNGAGGGSGINMDGVQASTVQNNLVYGSLASGISLYQIDGGGPSSGNVIANNTVIVASTGRWALNVQNGATNTTVFNNAFYNYGSFRGVMTLSADSLPGLTSDYNAVMNRFQVGDGSVLSLTQWQAQTGQDRHSVIIADPAATFINPAGGDYRLRAGSIAIDAGTAGIGTATAPTFDLELGGRIVGPTDIGAYEYGAPQAGDANMDGQIDWDDFALVDRARLTGGTGWTSGDFNGDGVVDDHDDVIVQRAWVRSRPVSLPPGLVVDQAAAQREAREDTRPTRDWAATTRGAWEPA